MAVLTIGQTPQAAYQTAAYPNQPVRSVVVTNNDTSNPVFYSDGPGTIDANSSQILAGAAETFDGNEDVWLSTLSASVIVKVDVKVGSQNSAPGSVSIQGNVQATVSGNVNVANTPSVNVVSGSLTATVSGPVEIEPTPGSPLDVSAAVVNISPSAGFIAPGNTAQLAAFTNQVVAANSSDLFPPLDCTFFPTYDIGINAWCASQSTAGAPLTCQIQATWYDDASLTLPVYTELWEIWVANSQANSTTAYGTGVNHGRYLQLSFINPGGQSITFTYRIYGTSRQYATSSWRQAAPVGGMNSGLTMLLGSATALGYDNDLANIVNLVMGGSSTQWQPLPLYAGPVSVRFSVVNNVLAHNFIIASGKGLTNGSLVAGTGAPGLIWNDPNNTVNTEELVQLIAPRSPLYVVAASSASAPTISLSVKAQQGT